MSCVCGLFSFRSIFPGVHDQHGIAFFFFFFFGAVLFEGGLEINLLLTVVCMRYDVRLISYCSPMHIVMSHF